VAVGRNSDGWIPGGAPAGPDLPAAPRVAETSGPAYPYPAPVPLPVVRPYSALGTSLIYVVLLGRDVVFLLMVSGIFGPTAQDLTGLGRWGPLTYVLPTVGAIGCLLAVAGLARALPAAAGWVGLAMAVAGSSFPGILIFAPAGGFVALLALVAHLLDEHGRARR
jgi:hypothetical protein